MLLEKLQITVLIFFFHVFRHSASILVVDAVFTTGKIFFGAGASFLNLPASAKLEDKPQRWTISDLSVPPYSDAELASNARFITKSRSKLSIRSGDNQSFNFKTLPKNLAAPKPSAVGSVSTFPIVPQLKLSQYESNVRCLRNDLGCFKQAYANDKSPLNVFKTAHSANAKPFTVTSGFLRSKSPHMSHLINQMEPTETSIWTKLSHLGRNAKIDKKRITDCKGCIALEGLHRYKKQKKMKQSIHQMKSQPETYKSSVSVPEKLKKRQDSKTDESKMPLPTNLASDSRLRDAERSEPDNSKESNNIDFSMLYRGVIKLFVDADLPSFSFPWQTASTLSRTGSGFIISKRRILTNAHVISYHTRILVRKYGTTEKFPAAVLAVAHEADLALLTVIEDRFWDGTQALQFSDIPKLQDAVTVVGYPTGGEQLSITKGVVSRVGMSKYSHSGFYLLTVQIDAAINPGNSGGPAFVKEKVAGIAFQGFNELQNVGYVQPVPLIRHFLKDLSLNCQHTGIADIGVECQPMENKAIQQFFWLDIFKAHSVTQRIKGKGILVTSVDKLRHLGFRKGSRYYQKHCSIRKKPKHTYRAKCESEKERLFYSLQTYCHAIEEGRSIGLQVGDIILKIGDFEIANDGTVEFRRMERVDFKYSVMQKFTGDVVEARVLRNGVVQIVMVPLAPPNPVVPLHTWDVKPSYFIFGGLVFTPLTRAVVEELYQLNPSKIPVTIAKYLITTRYKKYEDEEIVLLREVLASELTVGYDALPSVVSHVNNRKVRNLKHLIHLIGDVKTSPGGYIIIEIEGDDESTKPIILNRFEAISMGSKILKEHRIAQDRFLST